MLETGIKDADVSSEVQVKDALLMENSWEHFHHSADIGIRGTGETIEEALRQAGIALTAIVIDPDLLKPTQMINVRCKSSRNERLLLYAWLNAIIFEMATRRMVFADYEICVVNLSLEARAYGAKIDDVGADFACEIKGATMTELKLQKLDSGFWLAQAVIDV